jgi:hypothetical protein
MDWRYNSLWIDQLPPGQFSQRDFRVRAPAQPSAASYLFADGFKPKSRNFYDLPADRAMCFLHMVQSNVESFDGVSTFAQLKRLELHYCLKLESDRGLGPLSGSLEWLHISQSRKFAFGDELLSLRGLKVLCLNDCGPIPSLSFLDNFPDLVDFRFVGTNILDGDLTPLLRHPRLCNAGFLDKLHYNLKSAFVEQQLKPKFDAAVLTAHKGPHSTFRYKVLGE